MGVRLGTGPSFSDPTRLAGYRPVQNLDLTGRKPIKNRSVTILDFTDVKPVHFIHQLNTQYFRETAFYFSLTKIYTVKLI